MLAGTSDALAVELDGSTEVAWEEHEWEERSAETSIWQHMIAGSVAGMVEHTVMFPMDTIKTHVQANRVAKTAQTGEG